MICVNHATRGGASPERIGENKINKMLGLFFSAKVIKKCHKNFVQEQKTMSLNVFTFRVNLES